MPVFLHTFSIRQRLRCVRSAAWVQHVARQTAADDSVWCEKGHGQQHGDVYVHSVSSCIRRISCSLRLDQRLLLIAADYYLKNISGAGRL